MGMIILLTEIVISRRPCPKLHKAMDGTSGKLDEGGTK